MPRIDPIRQEEIDGDMNLLEHDVRQFKIEFEQYFGGGKVRPPKDLEWRIDSTMKRYGDRTAQMNYGQRFRFGNLAQNYVKLREIFHKRMRRREEGKQDRHFGATARDLDAERARARKTESPAPVAVSLSDPLREPEKVQQLFAAFREALERSGESTERLSREQFEGFLKKKTAELHKRKELGAIEFVVSVEDGKPRLKARVTS